MDGVQGDRLTNLQTGHQGHDGGKMDFRNQAKEKVPYLMIGFVLLRFLKET